MLFDRADNENGKRALLRVAKTNQTGFFQVLLLNVVGINEELDFDGLIALNEATLFNYRVITDILLKQGTVSSTDKIKIKNHLIRHKSRTSKKVVCILGRFKQVLIGISYVILPFLCKNCQVNLFQKLG